MGHQAIRDAMALQRRSNGELLGSLLLLLVLCADGSRSHDCCGKIVAVASATGAEHTRDSG